MDYKALAYLIKFLLVCSLSIIGKRRKFKVTLQHYFMLYSKYITCYSHFVSFQDILCTYTQQSTVCMPYHTAVCTEYVLPAVYTHREYFKYNMAIY